MCVYILLTRNIDCARSRAIHKLRIRTPAGVNSTLCIEYVTIVNCDRVYSIIYIYIYIYNFNNNSI